MFLTAYQFALTALALRVVNRFSWGRNIATLLITLLLLLIIIAVIVVYLSNLIENVFVMFGV
jgi:hypothetical protein